MVTKIVLLLVVLTIGNAMGYVPLSTARAVLGKKLNVNVHEVTNPLLNTILTIQKDTIIEHMSLGSDQFNRSYCIPEAKVFLYVLGETFIWTTESMTEKIEEHAWVVSTDCDGKFAAFGFTQGSRKSWLDMLTAYSHRLLLILVFGANPLPEDNERVKKLKIIFEINAVSGAPEGSSETMRILGQCAECRATQVADDNFDKSEKMKHFRIDTVDDTKYLYITNINDTDTSIFDEKSTNQTGWDMIAKAVEEAKRSTVKALACSRGRTWTSTTSKSDMNEFYLGSLKDTEFVYVVVAYKPQSIPKDGKSFAPLLSGQPTQPQANVNPPTAPAVGDETGSGQQNQTDDTLSSTAECTDVGGKPEILHQKPELVQNQNAEAVTVTNPGSNTVTTSNTEKVVGSE